jgi:hypothetical protein
MGRFVKNKEIHAASDAIRVPFGPTALRPQNPVDGQIRYNLDTLKLEYRANNSWVTFAHEGSVNIIKDVFIGDGITSSFSLSFSYQASQVNSLLVFFGNVFQEPGVSFTVLNNIITFTSVPDVGIRVIVLHNFSSTVAA